MFTLPASNVSVGGDPTVVIRTRSSVPESAIEPEDILTAEVSERAIVADSTQVFPVIKVKTIFPYRIAEADAVSSKKNPAELTAPVTPDPFTVWFAAPKYPVVVNVVDPSCTNILDVPLVLTPLNITVIRFTQLGMPVKSMLVPDVEATAVPEVIPSTAPELIVTLAEPSIVVATAYPS